MYESPLENMLLLEMSAEMSEDCLYENFDWLDNILNIDNEEE